MDTTQIHPYMATIVNNPSSDSSNAGWIVAAVVLIAVVLVAIFVWPGYGRNAAAPAADTTNIEVTIPNPIDAGAGGDRSGAESGMGGEEIPQ